MRTGDGSSSSPSSPIYTIARSIAHHHRNTPDAPSLEGARLKFARELPKITSRSTHSRIASGPESARSCETLSRFPRDHESQLSRDRDRFRTSSVSRLEARIVTVLSSSCESKAVTEAHVEGSIGEQRDRRSSTTRFFHVRDYRYIGTPSTAPRNVRARYTHHPPRSTGADARLVPHARAPRPSRAYADPAERYSRLLASPPSRSPFTSRCPSEN